MAGQRLYNTNPLTTGRNTITATAALTVDTSKATGSATIVNGKSIGVSGANGVITFTMPEKFAKCEYIDARIVDTGKTGNVAVLTVDYNPANATAQFAILSSAQAAVTTGVYKVYFTATFVLG